MFFKRTEVEIINKQLKRLHKEADSWQLSTYNVPKTHPYNTLLKQIEYLSKSLVRLAEKKLEKKE